MRTNKIDGNSNFKALKINPKLRPQIINQGKEFLKVLDKCGMKISDVKLYDVVFDESIHKPKIFSHDKYITTDYFDLLRSEENCLGKWYQIPAGLAGDTAGGFYPDEPRVFRKLYGEAAKKKYADFKKLYIYDQACEYSRMLEELDIKHMVAKAKEESSNRIKEIQKNEALCKLNQQVDEILEKYKYEAPTEPESKPKKEISKKSWWKKIFG